MRTLEQWEADRPAQQAACGAAVAGTLDLTELERVGNEASWLLTDDVGEARHEYVDSRNESTYR